MTLCLLNLKSAPVPMPLPSLELCTESLGFESGDGRIGEGEDELDVSTTWIATSAGAERVGGRRRDDERRREFPPPLRWIGEGFQMKAERRDGRLILTEVWTERSDVFRVSREDGRLRLQLIGSEEEEEEEEEEEGGEEGWDWGRGERREGIWRCQEAVSGNGMPLLWSNHRFLTTA